ncbi:hypothetical protein MCAMS1_00994 [biofilm metagenome]
MNKLFINSIFFAAAVSNSVQQAYAHDGFSKEVIEGTFEKMELIISHGCDDNPIIAQSVLFPTLNPTLRSTDSNNNPVKPPNDLSEVIDNGNLEGLVDLVQDRSIFLDQDEKLSELSNPIGFYGKKGFLKHNLLGSVPFKFFAPFFTANTCYSKIFVETAIADICSTKAPAIQPGKISLFIPDNGSRIGETAKANGAEHGVGEPSVLTIKRNLETNPFLDSDFNPTTACGEGINVWVTPSAEDVDKNLPIPGFWPDNKQRNHKKNNVN